MKKFLLPVLACTLAITPAMLAQAAPATPPLPATQAAPSATQSTSIAGKWHFVFDTEGGDREFEADFSVDADGNVTGTWQKTPATGTFKDGHLLMTFEFTSEEVNETAPLHLDGKFDDPSTLSGTWQFSTYEGTFKATRPKPAEPLGHS